MGFLVNEDESKQESGMQSLAVATITFSVVTQSLWEYELIAY